MKRILSYSLWLVVISSNAQNYRFPILPKAGNSAWDFAPKGWSVTDSIHGDLNRDDLADIVFVLRKKDSVLMRDKDGNDYKMLPQALAIAVKNSNGYRLLDVNSEILIDYNFPETYGPPFSSMDIKNNVLILVFSFDYINGNFYFYTYKFRFQKSQFFLIGADTQYVTRRTMDFEKKSYNFLTKKWSLTTGIYSEDDPPKLTEKTEWFNLKALPLRSFKKFNGSESWESLVE